MTGGQRTQAKIIGVFCLIFAPLAALIVKMGFAAQTAAPPPMDGVDLHGLYVYEIVYLTQNWGILPLV